MATNRRLDRLEQAIGDPLLPSRDELRAARARVLARCQSWLGICLVAIKRHEPLPSRLPPAADEEGDEALIREWNAANGISADGARDELLRRLDRMARLRLESAATYGAGTTS